MVDKVTAVPPPAAAPAQPAPADIQGAVQVLAGGRTTSTFVQGSAPAGGNAPAAAPAAGDRPAWLPAKFGSGEALAQAYAQLEQRLHGGQPAPAPAAAPASLGIPDAPAAAQAPAGAPASAKDLEDKMSAEYVQQGEVSAETRAEFKRRTGLSDTYIDTQIRFMKAQEKQALELGVQRLGGEEAVRELQEWAGKRLTPTDRAAFNRAVYSGDPAMVQLALDGLAAKFESEVGRSPRVIAGRRPMQQLGGAAPFQSDAELAIAVRDPRYKSDPGFRAQVEDRLRVAQEMGLIQ